jgi:hypothetical protein
MTNTVDQTKLHALQAAIPAGGPPQDVVARANHYHKFLTSDSTTAATGASGTATAATGAAASGATTNKPKGRPAGSTNKPKDAPAAAPAETAELTQEQVRDIVRRVAGSAPPLGKQAALDILDATASVQAVSKLDKSKYAAVYEACQIALGEKEANEEDGDEEDDPTA